MITENNNEATITKYYQYFYINISNTFVTQVFICLALNSMLIDLLY